MFNFIIKLFKTPLIFKEFYRGTIYYENISPKYQYLQEKDIIQGFVIYSTHYNAVIREKIKLGLMQYERKQFDNRIGYYIDGKKIDTKIHPLHSKQLLNIKTGKRYIIDTVTYNNYFGEYITLMVREEGSKSHKEVLWEDISCHNPTILNSIKQNNKKYKLIDKIELYNY